MEKGNALGADVQGLVGTAEQAGLVERATTVTTVVTGMGAQAGEALKDAALDKASDAAIEEARERIRKTREGQQPTSDAGDGEA